MKTLQKLKTFAETENTRRNHITLAPTVAWTSVFIGSKLPVF